MSNQSNKSEKVVAVLWRDAKIFTYKEGERVYPVRNVSVGILVGSSKEVITLANNIDLDWFLQTVNEGVERERAHDERRSELIRYLVIPRGMVEKIIPVGTLSPRQFPAV